MRLEFLSDRSIALLEAGNSVSRAFWENMQMVQGALARDSEQLAELRKTESNKALEEFMQLQEASLRQFKECKEREYTRISDELKALLAKVTDLKVQASFQGHLDFADSYRREREAAGHGQDDGACRCTGPPSLYAYLG